MSVWTMVDIDGLQEDQVQLTYNADGSIDAQLIQTWVAVTDYATSGDKSLPTLALTAAVAGGNAVPQITEYLLLGGSSTLYQVTRAMPKRTGPGSFSIQIEAHWKYTPPPPTTKFNVDIDFSGQSFTQDAYQDKSGDAIVNSAWQSFDPTIPEEFYDERIEISYNVTSDQSASFAAVRGCVNNASLSFNIQGVSRTFPERGLKCEDVKQSASLPLGDGTKVFKVTGSFISRADTYITNVADQGLYQLSSGALVPCTDGKGKAATTPMLLNGSGVQLAAETAAVFITFKMETEADFSTVFTGLA